VTAVKTRLELLQRGQERVDAWLGANPRLPPVDFQVVPRERWRVAPCAYYRDNVIHICPEICAMPGYAGRAWSWPGYAIDRTPYGVLAHELGHHVDWHSPINPRRLGPYYSDFSGHLRKATGSAALTGYAPNDWEWFAEMFRLFVTNPDLLRAARPHVYDALKERFNTVQPERPWREVLHDAPLRTITAAERKV
jgi:hypothetical protein